MIDAGHRLEPIAAGLAAGHIVPYLGPGVLELTPGGCPVPTSPDILAAALTAKISVPHKIRNNLTAAAQFIENFKHRKTLSALLGAAFLPPVEPGPLHRYLAGLPALPLVVDVWYAAAMQMALLGRPDWGQVQGVSQAEHHGTWVRYYHADGTEASVPAADGWQTLLYQPLGSIAPARNFIVSDSDYVEVLTEIDIQTPIPLAVQRLRAGRSFLFLGCRFCNQLERSFARQITKRSTDHHWAVLPDALTKNEARFLQEQGIEHIDLPLAQAVEVLGAFGS